MPKKSLTVKIEPEVFRWLKNISGWKDDLINYVNLNVFAGVT